ncbi:hypothetical protein ZIOFF_056239 [Zingiber officinale]|uniref:Carboxypeptidase n=1 Tax=Zingiber officinale TaxID=94328 RepID=A0A8J5FNE3_ZINOF|nr:hypothetical protein ZIOFF_056239 [Zingiber officinale]
MKSKVYDNSRLKEGDKVVLLPDQPEGVNFDQYAGYVTVNRANGRALFYYFDEAAENSGSKPIGSGCLSLGYGAMEELSGERLVPGEPCRCRPLLLQHHVDYAKSEDHRTATDALAFLVNWFELFPEYKGRDFFITDESYAGHYIPQLAHSILHNKDRLINLKGIAISNESRNQSIRNAVINKETDSKGTYDYFWTHALIADETIRTIHKFCNFSSGTQRMAPECDRVLDEASLAMEELDVYNIYTPLCFSSGVMPTPKAPSICLFRTSLHLIIPIFLISSEGVFNQILSLTKRWLGLCSSDFDGVVPVTSTRYSLKKLKLKVKAPRRAWMLNSEVGGYTVVYDHNLTFVTVRGARHEVQSYQPAQARETIKNFLQGLHLPTI